MPSFSVPFLCNSLGESRDTLSAVRNDIFQVQQINRINISTVCHADRANLVQGVVRCSPGRRDNVLAGMQRPLRLVGAARRGHNVRHLLVQLCGAGTTVRLGQLPELVLAGCLL